ncbi:MAG TPA: hypothetical protein VEQ37_13895 [Actinomycetota bacterium]|nr:hypothetical protein [Actinomycetota bacterium]
MTGFERSGTTTRRGATGPVRVERLRDVERARRKAAGRLLGRLGGMATFAVVADA